MRTRAYTYVTVIHSVPSLLLVCHLPTHDSRYTSHTHILHKHTWTHTYTQTGSHCWSVFMCLCIGLFMCAYVHYMVACSCVLVFLCVVVPFAYVYVCVCRGVRGPPPRQALGPGIRKEPEPTVTVQGPISLLVLPPRFLFFRNLFPFLHSSTLSPTTLSFVSLP